MGRTRWFTRDDEPALTDFWTIWERCFEEVNDGMLRLVDSHPLLGRVFEGSTLQIRATSRQLVRKGVEEDDWSAYEDHIRRAAASYAKHGVSFDEWYSITRVIVDVLTPAMVEAYSSEPERLKAALHVLRRFNDELLIILTTHFMEAKQAALTESENRLRALTARQQVAIEEERTRIAREIHDELGQQLTAIKLDLAWLLRRYQARERVSVDDRLRAMSDLVDETIKTVRRIATQLRPGILDDLGLVAALEWQARDVEKRTGIRIDFGVEDEEVALSRDQATALFRCFQEILTNVMRHARAQRVRVRLDEDEEDGAIVLDVRDDGRGISEREIASGTSLGLLGMRERVALFGGTLDIEGAPGAGTHVTVRIPRRRVR